MKTIKYLAFTGIIIISVLALSCQKEKQTEIGLTENVVGTYKGTLKSLETGNTILATADIIKTDESIVQIHCYSTALDTTFVMEMFEYGDSLMLCNIGNDFKDQYGHDRMNEHHMMEQTNRQDWTHHMDEEHNQGDVHYGGFNMVDHSFGYTFIMGNDSTLHFNGKKQ